MSEAKTYYGFPEEGAKKEQMGRFLEFSADLDFWHDFEHADAMNDLWLNKLRVMYEPVYNDMRHPTEEEIQQRKTGLVEYQEAVDNNLKADIKKDKGKDYPHPYTFFSKNVSISNILPAADFMGRNGSDEDAVINNIWVKGGEFKGIDELKDKAKDLYHLSPIFPQKTDQPPQNLKIPMSEDNHSVEIKVGPNQLSPDAKPVGINKYKLSFYPLQLQGRPISPIIPLIKTAAQGTTNFILLIDVTYLSVKKIKKKFVDSIKSDGYDFDPATTYNIYLISSVESSSDPAGKIEEIETTWVAKDVEKYSRVVTEDTRRAPTDFFYPNINVFFLREADKNHTSIYPNFTLPGQASFLYANSTLKTSRNKDNDKITAEITLPSGKVIIHKDLAHISQIAQATFAMSRKYVQYKYINNPKRQLTDEQKTEISHYYLLKRAGDWCQALCLLDRDRKYNVFNENWKLDKDKSTDMGISLNELCRQIETVDKQSFEIALMTHDRVLLSYALQSGLNVYFTFKSTTTAKDRKAAVPSPKSAADEDDSASSMTLLYFKNEKSVGGDFKYKLILNKISELSVKLGLEPVTIPEATGQEEGSAAVYIDALKRKIVDTVFNPLFTKALEADDKDAQEPGEIVQLISGILEKLPVSLSLTIASITDYIIQLRLALFTASRFEISEVNAANALTIGQLKVLLASKGVQTDGFIDKSEYTKALLSVAAAAAAAAARVEKPEYTEQQELSDKFIDDVSAYVSSSLDNKNKKDYNNKIVTALKSIYANNLESVKAMIPNFNREEENIRKIIRTKGLLTKRESQEWLDFEAITLKSIKSDYESAAGKHLYVEAWLDKPNWLEKYNAMKAAPTLKDRMPGDAELFTRDFPSPKSATPYAAPLVRSRSGGAGGDKQFDEIYNELFKYKIVTTYDSPKIYKAAKENPLFMHSLEQLKKEDPAKEEEAVRTYQSTYDKYKYSLSEPALTILCLDAMLDRVRQKRSTRVIERGIKLIDKAEHANTVVDDFLIDDSNEGAIKKFYEIYVLQGASLAQIDPALIGKLLCRFFIVYLDRLEEKVQEYLTITDVEDGSELENIYKQWYYIHKTIVNAAEPTPEVTAMPALQMAFLASLRPIIGFDPVTTVYKEDNMYRFLLAMYYDFKQMRMPLSPKYYSEINELVQKKKAAAAAAAAQQSEELKRTIEAEAKQIERDIKISRFIAILKYYNYANIGTGRLEPLINNITSNYKDASDILLTIRIAANNLQTIQNYEQIKTSSIVINILRAAIEDIPSFLETVIPQGAPASFNIKRENFTIYAACALRYALTDYTYSKAINLYKIVKELIKHAINPDLATIHTQIQDKYAVVPDLGDIAEERNEDVKNIYLLHMYKLYQTDKANVQKFLIDGINENIAGSALVKTHTYMEVLANFIKLGMILNPEQFRVDMNTMFNANNATFKSMADTKTLSAAEFNSLINSYLDGVDMPIKAIFKNEPFPAPAPAGGAGAAAVKRRSRKFSKPRK